MAFQSNAAVSNTNNANTGNVVRNDNWKAQAFLNFYVTTKEGTRMKLGAIPLKESISKERKILEFLKADPANIDKLLAKIELDFQVVGAKDDEPLEL